MLNGSAIEKDLSIVNSRREKKHNFAFKIIQQIPGAQYTLVCSIRNLKQTKQLKDVKGKVILRVYPLNKHEGLNRK